MKEVSIFSNVVDTQGKTVSLSAILGGIKNGKWANQISELRSIKDEKAQKAFKNTLSCFTGSGVYKKRTIEGLVSHSGALIIDTDVKDNPILSENFDEIRQKLIADKHTLFLFTSCRGNGIAIGVRINGEKHGETFQYLEHYYLEKHGLTIDKGCKDVTRLRFISYDPDLYYNVGAETVIVPPEFTKETKLGHTAPVSHANGKNHEIVEKIIASGKLLGDDTYESWVRIAFALVSEFGEGGRLYFHELSRISPKYDRADCDKKYDNCLRTNKGAHTFASIVHFAKELMETTEFELDESLLELEKKPNAKKKSNDKNEPVLSVYFEGLVDVVTDNRGRVAYLVNNENSPDVVTVKENDKVLYAPPDQKHLPFALADADNVLKWYKSDNDQILFKDVLTYLKRFSYLPGRQWLIVACNVFLSYLQDHPDIHYLPMLLFYAVPERGK